MPDPTLYATVVKLVAIQDGKLPATQGRLAHAAFLDIIRAVDPELAETLHAGRGRKPFTVSPLRGLPRSQEGHIPVQRGRTAWLRFTLMGGDLFTTFTRRFLAPTPTLPQSGGGSREGAPPPHGRERAGVGAGVTISIGQITFAVGEVLTTPGSHPWAGYATPGELGGRWASTPPDQVPRQIKLELASPTVFSRRSVEGMGKFMDPIPTPAMLFGSVAAVWNEHMPTPLDKGAIRAYAEETVVVGLYNLRSKMFRYWGQPQIGATGTITYLLKDKKNRDMIRTLNTLADFAFYSGVGYKTTMGMGQVRRET
jgi:CRISPR-associated endoribonuclease Cas6